MKEFPKFGCNSTSKKGSIFDDIFTKYKKLIFWPSKLFDSKIRIIGCKAGSYTANQDLNRAARFFNGSTLKTFVWLILNFSQNQKLSKYMLIWQTKVFFGQKKNWDDYQKYNLDFWCFKYLSTLREIWCWPVNKTDVL